MNVNARIKSPSVSSLIYPWFLCAVAAIFYCYEYYLRISPSVMAPQLMQSYNLTAEGFGNLAAYYYYAYTPMQFFVGLLFDKLGVRRLLAAACLCCAIGIYLFAFSSHLYLASIGRFLIGFGSAFAFVGTLKLASIWLPPERFGMVAGLVTSLGMVGAVIGDISLSFVVQYMGWRTSAYMMAVSGIILAFLLFLIIRDKANESLDVETQPQTEESLTTRQLFYQLWLALKNRNIWLAGIIGFCLYLSVTALAELWVEPYLQTAYHFSEELAASIGSVIFMGWIVGGPIAGLISDSLGRRKPVVMCGAIASGIIVSLILYLPHLTTFLLIALLFIYGFFSGVQVLTFAIAREVVDSRIAGTAVSLNNMIVMLGGVIFQPIIGVLLDWHWSGKVIDGVAQYSTSDYTMALTVLPISMVICFILVIFVKETYCKLKEER